MKKWIYTVLIAIFAFGCSDDDKPIATVVTVSDASDITQTSAVVNLTLNDTRSIVSAGVAFCKDASFPNEQIENVVTQSVSTTMNFTLKNLAAGTTYYYRGYVTDKQGNMVLSQTKEFTVTQADENITFSDAKFKAYCVAEYDTNGDGEISKTEAAKVTYIDVSGTEKLANNITSLQGIEYFTSLIYLNCSYTQLTSLDVSMNTALWSLFCYNTQLTSLDVSKNTVLEELLCSDTQLTSLDVSKNIALKNLSCFNTQLTTLDVSKNTALEELWCGYTQLTSLDVSKNTALKALYCNNNQLTNLDVSKNIVLAWLHCNNTQLMNLDVSKNIALKDLSCFNTQLTTLDVSKNTVLVYLACSNTRLTTLDVSKNKALEDLSCRGTPNLTTLYLKTGQKITDLYKDSQTVIYYK